MKNTLLYTCRTNILVRLLTKNMKNCVTPQNPKICDPLIVSPVVNATPSSGTSTLASYKEVPHHPWEAFQYLYDGLLFLFDRVSSLISLWQRQHLP